MNEPIPKGEGRRGFLKKFYAGLIGAVLGALPFGAGLAVFLDPLKRKGGAGLPVRVTSLDALSADGIPRKFSVLATRVDAWNKFNESPIGAVYLRRTQDGKVQAFNAVCPHAGCFVNYLPDRGFYGCPCHDSSFAVGGEILERSSPAARGLDSLEVEIRAEKEVWVRFQNFQAGRAEKVPV
jgi:menaquinol-cytochrome c reductase iron-sulfur subunit